MDRNTILTILNDWNFWNQTLRTGLPRPDYLEPLQKALQTNQILVLTGPRRAGKSFLMRQLLSSILRGGTPSSRTLMINFEDPRFESLDVKSLQKIYELYLETVNPSDKPFVFLDEIQEVANWEKWVRMMHELDKAHLILSGSNARLLSRELGTVLTGRHLSLTIMPLSFQESLSFLDFAPTGELEGAAAKTVLSRHFHDYLETGAFPECVLAPPGERRPILLQYFDDILTRDLIRRYGIRRPEALRALARFYLSQTGCPVTFGSLARHLQLTTPTVEKFSRYLEDAYLVFFLKRFSWKVREQDKSPRKVYTVDTGLANAIGFRIGANKGRLAETAVFLELLRRRFKDPLLDLYYWKDEKHREVDFVLRRGNRVEQLILVSWLSGDLSEMKTRQREAEALWKGMEALGKKEGLVLTESLETTEERSGMKIRYRPLIDWLSERPV